MNAQAYAARYGKRVPKTRACKKPKHVDALWPVSLLKALECISCNCDGGKSSPESLLPALTKLNDVIAVLKDTIIMGMEAYRQSDWFLTK